MAIKPIGLQRCFKVREKIFNTMRIICYLLCCYLIETADFYLISDKSDHGIHPDLFLQLICLLKHIIFMADVIF